MKNPLEVLKNLIVKKWSEAPSSATRDLLELYHTNPRLNAVRIIANKCASTDLYLYDRADFRKNKSKAEVIENHEIYDLLENPCPADKHTQREAMKDMLKEITKDIPFAKDRMFGAITNADRYNLWDKYEKKPIIRSKKD